MNLITSHPEVTIILGIFAIMVLVLFIKTIMEECKTCKHPERENFCCGRIAFVKCTTCGAESIPWQVTEETAKNWKNSNENYMERLLTIEANAKLYWSKR